MSRPKIYRELFEDDGTGIKLHKSIIPDCPAMTGANPPAISVSATTLAAGEAATVTKSGTDKAPVFTFGIPQGAKGDKGDKGDTGPAGEGLSQIGAATLYSDKILATTGSGNSSSYYPAVRRDAYGRVVEVGRVLMRGNCNCDCNCDCRD